MASRAYIAGATDTLSNAGIPRDQAVKAAMEMEKSAGLFNFSDYDNGGSGFGLGSLALAGLLSGAAAGTIAYNAGMEGSKYKPFTTNIMNYVGRKMNKYLRKLKPRPIYDLSQYFE